MVSSPNISLLQPNVSSTAYSLSTDAVCFIFGWTSIIFTTFIITNIFLLLPLCVVILHEGLQKWRRNPSYSPSASMSHCDCFTYHTVIMELIGVIGCIICSCGVFMHNFNLTVIGKRVFFFKWYGEVLFHVLTCLERYMAVVHPIIYMSLRNEQGIRIRNVTVACVWLLSTVSISLSQFQTIVYWELSFLMLALVVISFCSISVLWVLIDPRPGQPAKDRTKVDQSKLRASFTIVSTLVVLMLRVTMNVALEVVFCSTGFTNCVILTSVFWFHLPSSLVLPILFLYKERENVFKRAIFSKGYD